MYACTGSSPVFGTTEITGGESYCDCLLFLEFSLPVILLSSRRAPLTIAVLRALERCTLSVRYVSIRAG